MKFMNLAGDSISLLSMLDDLIFSSPYAYITVAAIVLVIAAAAYGLRQLTLSGAIATFLVGCCVTYILGTDGLFILLFFFVSVGIISKIAKKVQFLDDVEKIHEKGSRRDGIQVLANGFVASVACVFYAFTLNDIFLVMFASAIAEAASDSYASEVGVLSSKEPVSILNGRPVKRGISGGVSFLGTSGAFIGSLLIALLFVGMFDTPHQAAAFTVITFSGFFGCLVDSVLGATIQAHYYFEDEDRLTEKPVVDGKKLPLSRGMRFVDNDVVNFLSNIAGAVTALLLSLIFF